MSPFLKKLSTYIEMEHYSNFGTFEIASLPNVPGYYFRKYGDSGCQNDDLPSRAAAKWYKFVRDAPFANVSTSWHFKFAKLNPVQKGLDSSTLLMFCLLNPQMNSCEPNPKTTSSYFNRLDSVTKIFCFHAISKDIRLLF